MSTIYKKNYNSTTKQNVETTTLIVKADKKLFIRSRQDNVFKYFYIFGQICYLNFYELMNSKFFRI